MNRPRWSDFASSAKPTADVWQCPGSEVLTDSAYGYAPSSHGYHTYAMNQFLNYDYDPTFSTTSLYPSFLKLAKARSSAETLLMFETTLMPAAGFGQNPVSIACLGGYYPDENARSFGDRHPHQRGKLGGNVMMLDGHVEWRDHLWDASLKNPEKPPTTDRLWWPY